MSVTTAPARTPHASDGGTVPDVPDLPTSGAPSWKFGAVLSAAAISLAGLGAYLINAGHAKYALLLAAAVILPMTLWKKQPRYAWPANAKVPTWRLKVALVLAAAASGATACYEVVSGHPSRAILVALVPLPVALWKRPDSGRPEDAKAPTTRFKVILMVAAVAVAGIAADQAHDGHLTRALAVGLILLPVAIWKRPYLGPAILVAGAVLVEQTAVPGVDYTGNIPLFQGIGPGHLEGGDILILVIATIYLAKRHSFRLLRLPSHVGFAILGLLVAMVIAVVIGQTHEPGLREEFQQCRPFVYLSVVYFLTSALVTDRKGLVAVLWAFVLTVGFKSVQGLLAYYHLRHDNPRPETFIGHEMSQFFVMYIVLVLALWLFSEPAGRLRSVATRLLPLIIACDLVNDRRVAWEMLGFAVLTLAVIAYRAAPVRRGLLGKCVVGLMMIAAVYFPVFWNQQDSSLGQPARAVASQVNPSVRDADSDIYRIEEDENLQINIRQGGLLGKGFGTPIDYAVPMVDLYKVAPELEYVPHNNVLYILMDMGLLGGTAMWFLIGSGIIAGCRLTRCNDQLTKVIGTVLACSLVSYAIIGAVDVGFYWSRIAYVMGAMLGLAEAARRIYRQQQLSVARIETPLGG